MRVADLQRHLADLARLLESAGVKKEVVGDLNAIRDGLAPFLDLPLRGFADFLTRAEAYRRGGEVPVAAPKTTARKAGGRAAAAGPAVDVQAVARQVRQLYDQAADLSTTEAGIDAVLARLEPLDKKGLVAVADAIELKGVGSKTKPQIVAAIRQRIVARKGSSQRVGLLDRPVPAPAGLPGPSPAPPHATIQGQGGVGGS
jgi:hypothetical protein